MRTNSSKKIAEKIFRAKRAFHRERAMLPIEEKLKILIELQKIGIEVNPKFKDKKVWEI